MSIFGFGDKTKNNYGADLPSVLCVEWPYLEANLLLKNFCRLISLVIIMPDLNGNIQKIFKC